jgi:hypothetical protein
MEAMVDKLAKKEAKKAAKKAAKEAKVSSESDDDEPLFAKIKQPLPASPMQEEPVKAKRPPSAWAIALKEVYTPLVKEALGEGVKMNGMHMKVAGYLKKNNVEKPTLDDVKLAIEFLQTNPDYKSDTAQKKVDSTSESSEKKRGRPKKNSA